MYPFEKIFLYSDISSWSLTLNLGSILSFSISKPIYVLDLTSIGFFIVLWYTIGVHQRYCLT